MGLTCFMFKDTELTAPTSFFPFTMSTIWRAMSSPQRACASFVLAPRCGQLITLECSTNERSFGGSYSNQISKKAQSEMQVSDRAYFSPISRENNQDRSRLSCLNKNIKPCSFALSRLQRPEESCLVDDASTCTVHNLHSFLALSEGLVVKQTLGETLQLEISDLRPLHSWCVLGFFFICE